MRQDIRKIVSDNIKYLRKIKKISSKRLSIAIDMEISYISKVERCKTYIPLDKLVKLADFFEVESHVLLMEKIE